uniref:Secreted protein n=1 Tax=Amblyomma cajennense TaxID=34607 RepID=A0A023FRV2_AMBCJ
MIFPLAFCLGVIATAAAADAAGTNEHPKDLDMMKMAEVNETLVVVKRKHTNETKLRCQSAKKTRTINQTLYQYTLRARYMNGTEYQYAEEEVQVKLVPLRLGGGYRSKYTDKHGVKFSLRLRKMDNDGNCFVIMVNKNGTRGCELLVPASKITQNIATECDSYYNTTCKGDSLQLYESSCTYDQQPGC